MNTSLSPVRTKRRRTRLALPVLVCLLTAAVLTAGVQLPASAATSPAAAAATEAFVPVAGPVFGDPTAPRNLVLTRLMDNIAHTPRGATIRIVGYSFSLGNVATALLKAHARGVQVQVVMDGHSKQWSPAKRMVPVLGTDITQTSFFVLTHRSARGTSGVTHQKSWTFSQVGRTPNVVMVGSTNLTGYGTEVQYSDVYVYTDRADVYDAYTQVFLLQKRDTPVKNPFVSRTFDHGSAYFFPQPGTTATTDPALQRINALPANSGTTIGVSQFAWHDTRGLWLANALAKKKLAGATVIVVAGQSVGAGVKGILRRAGIPIYSGMYAHGKRIHTKLMLASYEDGTGSHTSIWTGSDNWADQSLKNDDDVLRVDDDAPGYAAYVSFFNLLTNPAAGGSQTGPLPLPLTPTPPPAIPGVPAAPTEVTAIPGNASAKVSWVASADNGSPVTGYVVTASPGGSTTTVAPDQTTATVAGLTNGTGYTFTVTAANAVGNSVSSAPSAAVTPGDAVVAFQATTRAVAENDGVVHLRVIRRGNTSIPASVHYARTSGTATLGADLRLPAGTVRFRTGETMKEIVVRIVNDKAREALETVVLSLSAPGTSTSLGSPTTKSLTIAASDQRPAATIRSGTRSTRRGHARTFAVRVLNDGNVTNTFELGGSAARAGSTVRYYSGASNVTALMRSRAGLRVTLAPGAHTTLKVRIAVGSRAAIGATKPATVTATWTGDGKRTDRARAAVRVVR